MSWDILYHENARKDWKLLKQSGLDQLANKILSSMKVNPYYRPPAFTKLTDVFSGALSRRIDNVHMIIYVTDEHKRKVKVLKMWCK